MFLFYEFCVRISRLSEIRGFAFDIFEDGVEVEVGSGYQSGQWESCLLSLNFSPSKFFFNVLTTFVVILVTTYILGRIFLC